MLFLHFFAVFYKKYSDLLQVVFQCKKYSESKAGNGTQRKNCNFYSGYICSVVLGQIFSFFRSFIWRSEETKNCFRNYLTF